ncbi:MAG: GGDEF domain-containing protein [Rhodothalassiaceae bacterium]
MSHAALLSPPGLAGNRPFSIGESFSALTRFRSAGAIDSGLVISELLSFAAAAEQEIAEQKRRIAELETLSRTDELTGLANRRAFDEFLKRAIAAAKRHGEQGLIGIVDLDGFKLVNDRFGHDAGDQVLRAVGTLLEDGLRTTDCAARLGGDEFALVLTRTSHTGGQKRLKQLQKAIEALSFRFEGEDCHIGASLGMVGFDGASEPRTLLLEADRRMYREKRLRCPL